MGSMEARGAQYTARSAEDLLAIYQLVYSSKFIANKLHCEVSFLEMCVRGFSK